MASTSSNSESTEDARREDRAHFELVAPRVYELGGSLPNDIREFVDCASCPDAELPVPYGIEGPQLDELTAETVLEVLLEAERCAIRTWSEICDMTHGAHPRTYDMAQPMFNDSA